MYVFLAEVLASTHFIFDYITLHAVTTTLRSAYHNEILKAKVESLMVQCVGCLQMSKSRKISEQ